MTEGLTRNIAGEPNDDGARNKSFNNQKVI